MISDIDDNLRNSISRLFADDTKISAKIRKFEDIKLLQQDLNKIYIGLTKTSWNLTKINSNK